jgi:hypothetical protein
MNNSQVIPVLLLPVIAWRFYSRFRRHVGRQPVRRPRLLVTSIIFTVAAVAIAAWLYVFGHFSALGWLASGGVLGGGLAILGLKLTQFATDPSGSFYTPNPILGVAVWLLLVGRLVYRLSAVYSGQGRVSTPPSLADSPMTLAIFGVTAGYCALYYLGVWSRFRDNPQPPTITTR